MSETQTLVDAEARRRIAEDLDTTFVVEAAAGTGKTTALVSRIVGLLASGRATAPKVTASSVPARPQDEVFAALLFGRSVSSLSALEGLELANSIAALSGGADVRGSVLGDLRNKFGLDVLAVDLGEGGNATVRAGSYLADNVYFELRQGGANSGTTGRVELQIDENISVETEVGPQSSSSVGARYKLDY